MSSDLPIDQGPDLEKYEEWCDERLKAELGLLALHDSRSSRPGMHHVSQLAKSALERIKTLEALTQMQRLAIDSNEERWKRSKELRTENKRLRALLEQLEDGIDDYWRTLPENQETMEHLSRVLEVK